MRRLLAVIALLGLLTTAAVMTEPAYKSVLRVSDGRAINFAAMVEELRKSDMVFLGETHDSARDHAAQLDVIDAFHQRDIPIAVGLEMFRAEEQSSLDRWVRGEAGFESFVKRYYSNWNLPWPLYGDIFIYAKDHSLPLIGLNIPAGLAEKISNGGFKSLNAKDLRKLPPGISCDVDDKYMAFIRQVYSIHEHSGKAFVNFCEVQMVWDKTMAWHLLRYKKKNPGKKIIVLAGTGHSWKQGIPAQIKRGSQYSFKVVLPEAPGIVQPKKVTVNDADYVLLQ